MKTTAFSRDKTSQALVSTNAHGAAAYKAARAQSQEVADLRTQINTLTAEFDELKDLIHKYFSGK